MRDLAPRSHLYVPGDAPDRFAKALGRGADALIVDLEDAVAPRAKPAARMAVADWLGMLPPAGERPEVWVRVNSGELREVDVRAVVRPGLDGVCVAKTGSAAELSELDRALAEAEAAAGLPAGSVQVAPLLETAAAVLAAQEIARAPRVVRLQIGEADLTAELGVQAGPDERELLFVRSHVLLASAAAGIEPPVGPVSTDFRDLDALRESTLALRRLGFRARAAIHPVQIPVIHEVFTPAPDEVARARALVEGFEEAVATGSGVLVGADGRMVDEAVVRAARHTLALARP